MTNNNPSPGSPEAIALGCNCQPRDFDEPENLNYPQWLTINCPIHSNLDRNTKNDIIGEPT